MTFSNSLADTVLDDYFTGSDLWLSLHSTSPLISELSTGELVAVTYSRQSVTWSASTNRSVHNTNPLLFSGLPIATIPFLGVYTAEDGGTLYTALEVDPAYEVTVNGGSLYIPAETLAVVLE